jgi:hypothetical protein
VRSDPARTLAIATQPDIRHPSHRNFGETIALPEASSARRHTRMTAALVEGGVHRGFPLPHPSAAARPEPMTRTHPPPKRIESGIDRGGYDATRRVPQGEGVLRRARSERQESGFPR